MADIGGRGFVVGIMKSIRQRNQNDMIFHTGGQRWLIDGETDPHALRGMNEEDDFGFVWGYQKVMTRWIGVPYHRTTGRLDHDGVIYRFFGSDPVPFRSSLMLECGSRADDTESIVYYYRARNSEAPKVRSPDHWQVTSPLPCPDFETFERAEPPERQHVPWGEHIEEGSVRLPIRTPLPNVRGQPPQPPWPLEPSSLASACRAGQNSYRPRLHLGIGIGYPSR